MNDMLSRRMSRKDKDELLNERKERKDCKEEEDEDEAEGAGVKVLLKPF